MQFLYFSYPTNVSGIQRNIAFLHPICKKGAGQKGSIWALHFFYIIGTHVSSANMYLQQTCNTETTKVSISIFLRLNLKALYTFCNCQRPVFSLSVSHYKHKITSLWKFGLNWSSKLRENVERKNILVCDEFVCFQIGIKDF